MPKYYPNDIKPPAFIPSIGDTVIKSSYFLRNTGQYFDDGTHGEGTIVDIPHGVEREPIVVVVEWTAKGKPTQRGRILTSNLQRIA